MERLEIRGSTNSIVYGLNNITGALQAQNVDTLNGEILTPRTITADRIVANSITGNEIAARTIIANNIVSGSITGNEIAAGTIKAVNIDVANLFAQDITATGTIRGVNLVGATGSFSGSVTIGASGGQMTLKTNDNYPIFTIEPTSGYSGYVQFSRGYFHFTDEENYEIYGGSTGLTLSAMGASPMKINASSGINVDVNDTIWLTSTNSAANVVLDGFNYLTVNGKVAVSGSLTANTVTSTALNITQYGRGMTCVTDFGNAAIVTLSDGSGLYLATNKTGVSGWASNILLADTNGVNLIPKTGGTFTGSVRCSAGLTVNGDLVETSNMILYHGKGLYGQADGGSNNWIAGIEKRSSGTSSAAVNCVRIGQNTLRTYVYTASSVYSNGAWNNFSDRRLKEEFTKLDKRYLDMFDNLNPTLFLWKDKRDTRKQAGYVAQEVLAAMNAAGISESENTIVNKTWEYYDIDNKEAGGMEIYSLEYEGIDTIAVYALQDTRITVKQHGEDIEDLKQKYLELANENILLKAQIEFLQQQIAA